MKVKRSHLKEILKEIIKGHLSEQDDTGVVSTQDPNEAERLAKKGINVNLEK